MSKYLIVGQGLAGTLLAFALLEKGQDVVVADDDLHSSASAVAAGMWNPVTFKRLAPSWLANELLEEMKTTFFRLEEKLQAKFFHPLPVARIFNSVQESNFWDEKSESSSVGKFLSSRTNDAVQAQFNAPFGNSEVNECGWLNVPLFRQSARIYFLEQSVFSNIAVSESEIQYVPEGVMWKEQLFDKVIVCTGVGLNEWNGLQNLDLIPNHGEVLDLEIAGLETTAIVNFGQFLLPFGNEKFRLGATYNWNETDDVPTEEAKELLLSELELRMKLPVKIESHKTGFRPTTRDRRPILGFSKLNNALGVFGGLGSKGVLLGPFFAKQMASSLVENIPIFKEVNAARF